jgi:cytochrome c-type biogenesis protein CcmE
MNPMTFKQKRIWYFSLIALFLGGAALIILTTVNDHLLFFMTPTDVLAKKPSDAFRLGGMVEMGSLHRDEDPLLIAFRVTDGKETLLVRYRGLVPDLFREGQGVVAEGTLSPDGVFQAATILAKHDETYMPREVADALKASQKECLK